MPQRALLHITPIFYLFRSTGSHIR